MSAEGIKNAGDIVSVSALIGVLVDHLPTATAFLVFIWTLMRIYEGFLAIKQRRRALAATEAKDDG